MQASDSTCCSQPVTTVIQATRYFRMPCSFLPVAWLLLYGVLFSSVVTADSLTDTLRIAAQGATELALQRIEQQQPDPAADANGWLRWERQRIELYTKAQHWQPLIQRINLQLQYIPQMFRDWFITQQVDAWLALGNGDEARKVLRRLIWLRESAPDKATMSQWRQKIIRSYLLDKQANAAHTAMLRHAQDYPEKDDKAELLRARVLLLAKRPKDAADLLARKKSRQARSLYLLAALRSTLLPANKVIQLCKKRLKNKKLEPELRLRLWAIIAEASEAEADTGQRAAALERIFATTRATQIDDGLFRLDAEQLWQVYIKHARSIGNQQQLLIGDDTSWFAEARKNAKNPLRQRTVYGLLTTTADSLADKNRAHDGLVKSLSGNKEGIEILRRLYLQSRRFPTRESLPPIVRYTLLDQALQESDLTLASELMRGLDKAPSGVEPLFWELRRARVFVMAGEAEQGANVLSTVLNSEADFDKQGIDRLMQVLFDLQTVGEHEYAYKLFARLLERTGDIQLRREILYWMADSRKAQQQYDAAAVLYMRSAEHPVLELPDLWAQSALYQAAEALTEAGFINDARSLYKRLLRISNDEARRAVLQRRLQQLWLRGQKQPAT